MSTPKAQSKTSRRIKGRYPMCRVKDCRPPDGSGLIDIGLKQLTNGVCVCGGIGVQEQQNPGAGIFSAQVACPSETEVGPIADHPGAFRTGLEPTTVVDHDQLNVWQIGQHGFEAADELRGMVVDGNNTQSSSHGVSVT